MQIIQTNEFKKYFGKTKAVDGINLSIEQGEIFGFLGPNGAGKTTTISSMMGFTKPTAGQILIFGKDSWKFRTELKSDIGYLSADVKLYPNLTGNEHIKLIESLKGKSVKANDLINEFDFDPYKRAGILSTGNKQKLGIILSLLYEPKLLIMDEPTRGLDPISQRMFYQQVLALKKNGVTVFMSSHNLSEVQKHCDHIGIIKSGKLIAVESLKSMQEKQIHKVKIILKNPTKNFVLHHEGIQNLENISDEMYIFDFEGDINKLFDQLAQYELADVEISHGDLEEIFEKYYN